MPLKESEHGKQNGCREEKQLQLRHNIQLNPGITDAKGPINFIHYRQISVIANIEIKEN